MSQVISFEGYFPPRRFDDEPWVSANIEEATDPLGPWTQIDTIALSPVDSDPSNPQERNMTTDQADDAMGLWYRVIFVDGNNDVSSATDPVQNVALSASHNYITREHLKNTLSLQGLSFADDDIDWSITSASRAVDDITHRMFWREDTETTRTYTPTWSRVPIDDLISLTSVTVDGSTVSEGDDFMLRPFNAPFSGRPYGEIEFFISLPLWEPSVEVTGAFGWLSPPAGVVTATTILATRVLRRQREAPFGIITVGIETGAVARIGRADPDVQNALCDYIKPQVMIR